MNYEHLLPDVQTQNVADFKTKWGGRLSTFRGQTWTQCIQWDKTIWQDRAGVLFTQCPAFSDLEGAWNVNDNKNTGWVIFWIWLNFIIQHIKLALCKAHQVGRTAGSVQTLHLQLPQEYVAQLKMTSNASFIICEEKMIINIARTLVGICGRP